MESQHLPVGCGVLLYVSEEQAPEWGDYVTASVTYSPLTARQEYRRGQGVHLRTFPTDYANTVVTQKDKTVSFRDGFVRARQNLSERVQQYLPAE